jgi:hypothetical protein
MGVSTLLDSMGDSLKAPAELTKLQGMAGGGTVKFRQLKAVINNVSVLCYSPRFAQEVIGSADTAVPSLVTSITNAFANHTESDTSAFVIEQALLALINLSRHCDLMRLAPDPPALLQAVTLVPCQAPAVMQQCVTLSLELLGRIAGAPSYRDGTVDLCGAEGGALSACVLSMQAHPHSAEVTGRAARVLLAIAKSPHPNQGVLPVVQQGGNRQVVASLRANGPRANLTGWDEPGVCVVWCGVVWCG